MSVRYRGVSPTEPINEDDESKKTQSTMVSDEYKNNNKE